jgi:antitoxin ParD1/3/4
MTAVTMNISLTGNLKSFVEVRVAEQGYSSASEYVRDLIRRDEEKAAEGRFEALIREGLESPLLPQGWPEHLEELEAHVAQRRSARASAAKPQSAVKTAPKTASKAARPARREKDSVAAH